MTTELAMELLPCPFCGKPTKLRDHGEIPGFEYRYGTTIDHDSDCPLSAWDGYLYATEAEAITAWNQRTPSPSPDTEGARGPAFLLKLASEDGEVPVYQTVAGMRLYGPTSTNEIEGRGIFLGSAALSAVRGLALSGEAHGFELSFEDGTKHRGLYRILCLEPLGVLNGEDNYRVILTALRTPSPEASRDAVVEAMRDDPFIDDEVMLGTSQQDARMEHYASVALRALTTPSPGIREAVLERLAEASIRATSKLEDRQWLPSRAHFEGLRNTINDAIRALTTTGKDSGGASHD